MTIRVVAQRLRPARRRLGVDPHARFATRRELRPLLVRRPVPGRFVVGRWRRWLVATESQRWRHHRRDGVASSPCCAVSEGAAAGM